MSQLSAKYGLGRVPQPEDKRDYLWRNSVQPKPIEVPATLLPGGTRVGRLGPVIDQGQTPHCVAFAATSVKMTEELNQSGRSYVKGLDPDELYWRCKEVDGIPNQDGTYTRAVAQVLQNRGEKCNPIPAYGIYQPFPETYFKIGSYVVLTDLQQIKEALYTQKAPVIFGMEVDAGIFGVSAGDPRFPEPTGNVVGGHEMVIYGYSDPAKGFWIKNSWGTGWGAAGFARLPYSWFDAYGWDAMVFTDSPVLP